MNYCTPSVLFQYNNWTILDKSLNFCRGDSETTFSLLSRETAAPHETTVSTTELDRSGGAEVSRDSCEINFAITVTETSRLVHSSLQSHLHAVQQISVPKEFLTYLFWKPFYLLQRFPIKLFKFFLVKIAFIPHCNTLRNIAPWVCFDTYTYSTLGFQIKLHVASASFSFFNLDFCWLDLFLLGWRRWSSSATE